MIELGILTFYCDTQTPPINAYIAADPLQVINISLSGEIDKISVKELKKCMSHFSEGSMLPKINAAISFLKYGKKVIITDVDNIDMALKGKAGTIITR